jgi:uncharacterized protein (TIGR02145 family)
MKKKHSFWVFPLVMMGILLSIASGCKKDDNDNTVTDADGNVYHTITIGAQTWMLENLRTTKYNDGTKIENVTVVSAWAALTSAAFSWYDNDSVSFAGTYGAMYNFYAVSTGKLAPKGWHVATDDEWTILENYLIGNGYNYDGTTTDNKIAKALASSTGWQTSTTVGAPGNTDYTAYRNKSGFTALPGGFRNESGYFGNPGMDGNWWSSTAGGNGAYYRFLSYNRIDMYRNSTGEKNGYSVRCIKD